MNDARRPNLALTGAAVALLLFAYGGARFLKAGLLPAMRGLTGDFGATFPTAVFAHFRPDFPTAQVWDGWNYGPMLHFLTAPLLLAPRWAMVPKLWAMINLAALAASFVLACRLSGVAKTTVGKRRVSWPTLVVLGAMWLLFQPLGTCFASGDIELVEMTLILGGLTALQSSRARLSGALLGTATMIKFLPIGFLAWFVVRRQWRAVIAGVAAIAVIAAVATVTLGWKESISFGAMGWAASSPVAGLHELSVTSLFLHRAGVLDTEVPMVRWFPAARATAAAQAGALASVLLAAGFGLLLIARRRRPISPSEIAVLFLTMFMILPWNHDYYYVFALVPITLLFLHATAARDWTLLSITTVGYLLISPPFSFSWVDRTGWFTVPFAYIVNYHDLPVLGALLLWFAATYGVLRGSGEDTGRQRRLALGQIAGVTVGLVAIVVLVGLTFRRSEKATAVSETVLSLQPGLRQSGGPALALSPDGRRLAYISETGVLCSRQIDQQAAVCWQDIQDPGGPFFSPDGKWIAFFAAGTLMRVPVTGGPSEEVLVTPGGRTGSWSYDPSVPRFGRQGRILFASAAGIHRLSKSADEPAVVVPAAAGEGPLAWPTILPSGEAVLFTIEPAVEGLGTPTIAAASLTTGRRTPLMRGSQPRFDRATGQLIYTLGGRVLAVPFNPDTLKVGAVSTPLVGNVMVTRDGGAQFALSEEGTLIYTEGSAAASVRRQLLLVDRVGSAIALPGPAHPFEAPRLSPDGRFIAATIRDVLTDVWMHDFSGGTPTRLTAGAGPGATPAWSPVGQALSFMSFTVDQSSRPAVYTARIDAPDREFDLLWEAHPDDSQQPIQLGGWSPDGLVLAGTQRDDLWLLDMTKDASADADDGSLKTGKVPWSRALLYQTPFSERNPIFSPDGRWIAYSSDRSGSDEIYVQSYPAMGAPQRVTTEGNAAEPLWSRDGRELFYRRGDAVMAVSVSLGAAFTAGSPRRLFEGKFATADDRTRNYDVTPDGRHFVMVGIEPLPQPGAREVRVLRNWSPRLPH